MTDEKTRILDALLLEFQFWGQRALHMYARVSGSVRWQALRLRGEYAAVA